MTACFCERRVEVTGKERGILSSLGLAERLGRIRVIINTRTCLLIYTASDYCCCFRQWKILKVRNCSGLNFSLSKIQRLNWNQLIFLSLQFYNTRKTVPLSSLTPNHCQQCNDTHTNDYLPFCPGTWRRCFSACNTFWMCSYFGLLLNRCRCWLTLC